MTKKTETEVLEVYTIWLHAYLHGDIATYKKYLDKDYHFIGSTDNEEFLNKKDTTTFFENTADQLAGKYDLRNETRIIEKFEALVFITHLFDAWFKNGDDWAYYGRFRFTNALKKNKEGWRFIYQHFSTTDSKTDEGETIGFDKVNAENQELREAIKRRTFELEEKNRELEVEGALDRIRAEAVAMKASSDLLDIVVSMRNEFTKLGHEAHYFWHMMWLPKTYEKAMTSGDGTKIGFVMQLPRHLHGDIPQLAKWEKSKRQTVVHAMDVEEALDYVHKMVTLGDFQNIDPQAPTEDDIRHIGGLTFIMARTSHGEIGYSLPGVVKNPPKEDIDILVKFAGAFDLAHQRFLDLKKAEKQTRETQIELALEKVRSRTMAMRHSDELQETSFLLDQQVRELGIKTWGCAFNIYGEKESTEWFGNEAGVLHTYTVPHEGIFEKYYQKGKKGESLFIQEFSGKECVAHYEYMSSLPVIGDVLKILKKTNNGFPTYQIDHVVYFKYGYLLFITREHVPDAHDIFKRFAKVFEQTYTRFLDLQKAEAQAREAQIEMALEKVRSRTMGMQHSEELPEAANVLFTEVQNLGIPAWSCGYNILSEDKKSSTCIMSSEGEIQSPFVLPLTKHKSLKPWHKAIVNNKDFFVYEQGGKDLVAHYDYMQSLPDLKETFQQLKDAEIPLPTFQVNHLAKFTNGFLLFITYERVPRAHDIFQRFAKVFEQTYTRFLDLKKAEAQAREAQIEAAMERIRSRSLAMHLSEELMDVITELRRQIDDLGQLDLEASVIHLYTDGDPMFESIAAVRPPGESGEIILANVFFPVDATDQIKHMMEMYASDSTEYTIEFGKEMAEEWHKTMVKYAPSIAERREGFVENRRISEHSEYWNFADFSSGSLLLVTHSEASKDTKEVLRKAAQVFDLAYRRYKDLKKAEAQAREAQIQLALERVRARAMAMQKSEELAEVSVVLFEELGKIGIKDFVNCGFNEIDEEKGIQIGWPTLIDGSKAEPYQLPLTGDEILDERNERRKSGATFLSQSVRGIKLKKHLEFIFKTLESKQIEELVKENFPDPTVFNLFFFNHGYLDITTKEPFSKKDEAVLIRCAKAFEQAYTRFLDLQKAEAQAREAQIEVAVERVRAESMAMHTTSDFEKVAQQLLKQIQQLGVDGFTGASILVIDENEIFTWWDFSSPGNFSNPKSEKFRYNPHNYQVLGIEVLNKWKEGDNYMVFDYDLKKLHKAIEEWEDINQDVANDFKKAISSGHLTHQWNPSGRLSKGLLAFDMVKPPDDDVKNITVKMTHAFEQAYTRFLDLQKAEKQTRKAQIEASLERVRARAMAMHDSNELDEVLSILCEQFDVLGILPMSTHMTVLDFENNTFTFRETGKFGNRSFGEQTVALDAMDNWKETVDKWKADKATAINKLHFPKEQLKEVWEVFHESFASMPEGSRIKPKDYPDGIYHTAGKHPFGYIGMNQIRPATEEEEQIVIKFANEFGRAYQRFLDLKKAESQTREAQINLAVERVRAKALAMHKSEDILEVVSKLKAEVMALEIPDIIAASIFLNEGEDNVRMWDLSSLEENNDGYQIPFDITFQLKNKDPNLYIKRIWENHEDYFLEQQDSKDFKRIIAWLREQNETKFANEVEEFISSTNLQHLHHAIKKLNNGKLVIDTLNPASDEMETILTKMGAAFDLAYKRFEDLQKAEAQTREAQIEAALEKIRSRSLAMHTTDELQEIVALVAEKLRDLRVIFDAGGVILCTYFPDNKDVMHWIAADDFSYSGNYLVPYFETTIFKDTWKSKNRGDDYFSKEFSVRDKNHFFKYAFEHSDYKHFPDEFKQHALEAKNHRITAAWSKNSAILIPSFTEVSPSQNDADILKRFAKVFEQAYIRFMDLKKAEERARETQIDIALERVRSRAMAMHQSDELSEAAELLYQEFYKLGVTPFSCGYLINDDENKQWKVWMTDANDESFKNFWTLPFNADRHTENRYKSWQKKEAFHATKLEGKENVKHHQIIAKYAPWKKDSIGQLPERLVLSSAHFTHGHLLIVTGATLTKEVASILTRFASVFDQTYIRFLDLKKAEHQAQLIKEEKERLEITLDDLQTTQTQLIQSEKMASLGELTAGIAHEIQNPLNFVNNFSEVSKELLDEMLEEMENGDMEEVKAIMDDVIQNLEKINHHGKRADGIVKGMLQHSRASGNKKEPTDINDLADEYLRLAYHGLRAKDKSFNAQLVTDFDSNIKTAPIIPQDMGRVILNLLTNAFYVVHQKQQKSTESYEPTVSISTKKKKDAIEIKVTDNGNGMPDSVKEKIFQPFFTTKPTGEGTGLGLSLSYDIITKGHGGELKVETEEGEGTTFIIIIPT